MMKMENNQYLIVNLDNSKYGIPITILEKIIKFETSQKIPESNQYSKGIINVRNEIIDIIDLRKILGFKTYKEFRFELEEDIKKSQEGHKTWKQNLDKILFEDEKINIEFNPDLCFFGKLYQNKLLPEAVEFTKFKSILNSFNLPHIRLHKNGENSIYFKQKNNNKKVDEIYIEIEKDLNTMNQIFEKTYEGLRTLSNEKVVILNIKNDKQKFGIIVDKIWKNTIIEKFNESYNNDFIKEQGKVKENPNEIINILNVEDLLTYYLN